MSVTVVKTSVQKDAPSGGKATVTVEVIKDFNVILQRKNIVLPDNKSDLLRLSDDLWKQDNKPSLWEQTEDGQEKLSSANSKNKFQEEVVGYILKNYTTSGEDVINNNIQSTLQVPDAAVSTYIEAESSVTSQVVTSVQQNSENLVNDYESVKTTNAEAESHDVPELAGEHHAGGSDPSTPPNQRSNHDFGDPLNADALKSQIRRDGPTESRSQRKVRSGLEARSDLQKAIMENSPMHLERFGLMGNELIEPVPSIMAFPGDWHAESRNNSGIIAGRDEHYRIRGHTKSGAVYVYAGRSPHDIATEVKDGISPQDNSKLIKPNNLIKDAAYLYLSQKSDPSPLLQVAEGTYGKAKKTKYPRLGLSVAAIKADDVVIMARESGIRLITGTDRVNSKGGEVIGKFGIDLIAGNDDSDLQPLVKGDNLIRYLTGMSKAVDELHAIVYSFLKSQIEFNTTVANHRHFDPFCIMLGSAAAGNPAAFFEGKNLQSTECLQAGTKSMLEGVQQQFNAAKQALNRVNNDFNSLNNIGKYKIVSERNRTN